jgi:hypothetical protein
MYPVAWVTVGREDYDSWYQFIGLLQKDLNINFGGEDWVIISDQQKVLPYTLVLYVISLSVPPLLTCILIF